MKVKVMMTCSLTIGFHIAKQKCWDGKLHLRVRVRVYGYFTFIVPAPCMYISFHCIGIGKDGMHSLPSPQAQMRQCPACLRHLR